MTNTAKRCLVAIVVWHTGTAQVPACHERLTCRRKQEQIVSFVTKEIVSTWERIHATFVHACMIRTVVSFWVRGVIRGLSRNLSRVGLTRLLQELKSGPHAMAFFLLPHFRPVLIEKFFTHHFHHRADVSLSSNPWRDWLFLSKNPSPSPPVPHFFTPTCKILDSLQSSQHCYIAI
jgi:hypothetical protein